MSSLARRLPPWSTSPLPPRRPLPVPHLDYWHKAARHALTRSAYFEAENHAKRGLAIIEDLTVDGERPRWQLAPQSCQATPLAPTKGYGHRETGEAYMGAHELCEAVDDEEAVFPVYLGLHAFHVVRGEFDKSSEVSATCLKLAEHLPNPQPMLFSLYVGGPDRCAVMTASVVSSTADECRFLARNRSHRALSGASA